MITTSAQSTNGLTDLELRASPVDVSASSLPLPTGAATETTVATLLREGTDITGASMPAGGSYGLGWLSAIWKALTDRLPSALVSGRLDVNVGAASAAVPVTDNSGSLTVDAPAGTPVFVRLSDGASAVDTIPVSFPGGVTAVGPDAHDTAVSGDPLLVAGYASTAAPTAVSADGDVVRMWLDRNGRVQIGDGGGSISIDGTVSVSGAVAIVDAGGSITVDGSVSLTGTPAVDTELPAAAALDDATANPTAPMVGAGAMLWDPVAAKWRRRMTYNRATAFASQSRIAGNYDSSVLDAAGCRFLYIYATLSVTGGGTLTIAVNDSAQLFRLATAGTAISTTTPVVYAMGAGLIVPATGITYVGQVWCIPVPGQFKIRATTTATSTFEVLYELVP